MTSILCMALLSLPAIFHVLLWETDLQRDQKADFVFNLHLKWFKMELFFTWHCLLRGQSGCWKDWLCRKEISWAFQGAPVCKPENLGGCVWKRKIQNSVFSYPACVMVLGVRWGETKVMGNPCPLNTGQCGQVLSIKPQPDSRNFQVTSVRVIQSYAQLAKSESLGRGAEDMKGAQS